MDKPNYTTDQSKYQNIVFGTDVTKVVPILKQYQSEIDNFFSGSNLISTNRNLIEVQKVILDSESILERKFATLSNAEKLCYLNTLVEEIPEVKETPFLSGSKIREILRIHPPKTLNHFLDRNSQLLCLSPRDKLSLTRFSENQEWQNTYHELLSETTLSDFEYRLPKIINIDANSFLELSRSSGNTLKPWGVSHSKETGVILFFENYSPNISSPHFLMLSVFLHYLFEVHYFSSFIESGNGAKAGEVVKKILKDKKPKYSFLTDGNAHDETLYWKKALEHLSKFIEYDHEVSNAHMQSITLSNGAPKSLNIIDILWNINDLYPNSETIYHLQQEVWYHILKHIGPTEEFESIVAESLTLDNLSFLRKIIGS